MDEGKACGNIFQATSCTTAMDFFGCQNGKAEAIINKISTGCQIISHETRNCVQNFGNGIILIEKFFGSCRNHSCGSVRKYRTYSFLESKRANCLISCAA